MEIMKGNKVADKAAARETSLVQGGSGSQEQPRRESMKGEKLGRQGGRGSQEQPRRQPRAVHKGYQEERQALEIRRRQPRAAQTRNHEVRHAWETRSGSQEQPRRAIMKGDTLGRQGGSPVIEF